MKVIIIGLLALALLVSGCTQGTGNTLEQKEGDAMQKDGAAMEKNGDAMTTGETKEFTIAMTQFDFSPSTITVNKGDTVKINVTSSDVGHGFSLPEFGVDLKPAVGETATAEFVADKTGTFTFRCNVFCGSGHQGMKGTLIVNG
jgi:cytochrome c oxidase subunit II